MSYLMVIAGRTITTENRILRFDGPESLSHAKTAAISAAEELEKKGVAFKIVVVDELTAEVYYDVRG